jgi:hypothetical protein
LWIFALDTAKNPRLSGCFRSFQGKKSPDRRFFGVLRAKRNKLPGGGTLNIHRNGATLKIREFIQPASNAANVTFLFAGGIFTAMRLTL